MKMFISRSEARMEKVVRNIELWLIKNDMCDNVRIYFNNEAWDYDNKGKKSFIKDIKGTDYFEYANNETISMSFEGSLYEALNMTYGSAMYDSFNKIDFDGMYYELGHSWNLSFVD